MTTIFDASSLLNLENGGVVPVVLQLPGIKMAFGPQVRQECRTIGPLLNQLVFDGRATLLDDESLPFGRYAQIMAAYNLGPGETECLAFAQRLSSAVSCDDQRARRMIEHEIGRSRLTGTIGLLLKAHEHGLLSAAEARAAHCQMIAKGGFLPPFVIAGK